MDILILHGWRPSLSSAEETYQPLIELLKKKGYRVYAPDLPGFGSSELPDRPFTVSDYAEWVFHYIKNHKLKKPLVIGHSFGGRVAIKLAVRYPHEISKLILTAVPGYPPVAQKKIAILKLIAKIGGFIFSLPILNLAVYPTRKAFYKLVGAWDYYHTHGVMRETFKNIISEDLDQPMTKIKTETFLVWGERDLLVPLWIARKMKQVIKGSRLSIISGGGHCVIYDEPDKFVAALDTIVKQE